MGVGGGVIFGTKQKVMVVMAHMVNHMFKQLALWDKDWVHWV